MLMFKGARCWYLGLGFWHVIYKGWDLKIACHEGVNELIRHIDRWEVIA